MYYAGSGFMVMWRYMIYVSLIPLYSLYL